MKPIDIFEVVWKTVVLIFIFWIFFSVMGSSVKSKEDSCGKVYGIDSFFNTNLFCEVENDNIRIYDR